jgi:hypothetical protein
MKSVVNFKPRPLYVSWLFPLDRGLCKPQSRFGWCRGTTNLLHLQRIEPRLVTPRPRIANVLQGRDSKPGSTEYEAGILIIQPLRSMSCHVLAVPPHSTSTLDELSCTRSPTSPNCYARWVVTYSQSQLTQPLRSMSCHVLAVPPHSTATLDELSRTSSPTSLNRYVRWVVTYSQSHLNQPLRSMSCHVPAVPPHSTATLDELLRTRSPTSLNRYSRWVVTYS